MSKVYTSRERREREGGREGGEREREQSPVCCHLSCSLDSHFFLQVVLIVGEACISVEVLSSFELVKMSGKVIEDVHESL